jgi:hypothetical protein
MKRPAFECCDANDRRQVQWPEGNVRLESLYLKPERMAWRIINGKFHHDGVLMLFPIFRYRSF